jgi:hypothetical protein
MPTGPAPTITTGVRAVAAGNNCSTTAFIANPKSFFSSKKSAYRPPVSGQQTPLFVVSRRQLLYRAFRPKKKTPISSKQPGYRRLCLYQLQPPLVMLMK